MSFGIDRATPFTKMADLMAFKKEGVTFIGRYLSASLWKSLTLKEAQLIRDAGLFVVSVYQNSNNKATYFTSAQGKKDGLDAVKRANSVGQPHGTTIYFAVDYDTGTSEASHAPIKAYFKAVHDALKGSTYEVGVYGSYQTCMAIRNLLGKNTKVWQTVAWSYGKKIVDCNLYQYQIDTPFPKVKPISTVDFVESNGNGGGWKVGS